MNSRLQWALLFIVTTLTLVLILGSVILAYTSRGSFYLVPFVGMLPLGYVWIRIVSYIFPKSGEDYKLEALKIKNLSSKECDKKQKL